MSFDHIITLIRRRKGEEMKLLRPTMLCDNLNWNRLLISDSGDEDFWISSMYFGYFVIISTWKKASSFIWTNLNPLHPRIFLAKFSWKRQRDSAEEDENVKSLLTDRRTTGDQKSSLKLSAQVNYKQKKSTKMKYKSAFKNNFFQHF